MQEISKTHGYTFPLKASIIVIVLFLLAVSIFANNISISNPKLTAQNTSTNLVKLEFTVSWENSFRVTTGPTNWDAAWIFAKYRVATASGGDGIWRHITLNAAGHTTPAGSLVKSTPEGAFFYRSAAGNGTFTITNAGLSWNYGTHVESGTTDFIDDDDAIEIKVFAIEMVYVPTGAFNVGGGGGAGAFTPTQINTANASLIGTGYPSGGVNSNALFPNGFSAFYCMKYEISQQQYVDFLNTLTAEQQNKRTTLGVSAPVGTPALFPHTLTSPSLSNYSRNGIDVQISGTAQSPAVFACNLDADNVFNEAEDGQWIACNFLHFSDWLAYLDWSGLRPMTELEYEKACRGNQLPVANEYAWGTASFLRTTGVVNPGAINELPGTEGSNVNFKYVQGGIDGPVRVGAFANAASSRALAGASFYGIMELTGNVGDFVIFAGSNPKFSGVAGNGQISSDGLNDVSNWPTLADAPYRGINLRGGNWGNPGLGVSERYTLSLDINYSARQSTDGGRGVRTAPL